MSPVRRGPLRVVLALLVAAFLGALTVAPAQAAAYRFWGFYQLENGAWVFAQKGPDQTVPADGSVDGWRYAVGDESSSRFPRAVMTFEQVCGSTAPQAGSKRVAVVVDFGRPADSENGATPPEPKAVCAVVPEKGTSTDVLKAAGELRVEKGLICSVAGYPAAGCGGEVKEVSAEAKAPDTAVAIAAPAASTSATPSTTAPADAAAQPTSSSSGGSTAAYVIVGLALLALIGYLVYRARSRAGSDA
ncbi:SCO2322 family protein [Monashia sp. NPDC004114]